MPVSSPDHAARIALDALSAEERRTAVLYLDDALVPAGTLRLGRTEIMLDRPARIAFVDLEPGANWGHPCRYLVIDAEGGALRSIPETMPPFLREPAPTLRVIARGPAEDWMLAAPYRPPD
jgi:hypothetical protein